MHEPSEDDGLEAAVVAAIAERRLLGWLAAGTGSDQAGVLPLLVRLHDAGEVDAVLALLDPEGDWGWSEDWLARQQVLTAVLPRLSAPTQRMMACIDVISEPTSQHTLNEAFLFWCEADLTRAADVIAVIDEGSTVDDRYLLGALIAGQRADLAKYLNISADMAKGVRPGGHRVGIRALGLLPAPDEGSVVIAVQALRSVLVDCELAASTRADALSAAMDIAARAPEVLQASFVELLALATKDGDPRLLDACAYAFGLHASRLATPVMAAMTGMLHRLDAGRKVALGNVGMGVYRLLQLPDGAEQAVGVLEPLLRRADGAEIFEHFQSVRHELCNQNPVRFSWVVVRWLMSGETALCAAAGSLVQEVHGQNVSLALPPGQQPLSDRQALFLARKAIGWFFIRPAAAVSLSLSLLGQVTASGAVPLAGLLYDPLLMNYPGSVKEHLQSALPNLSDIPRKAVESVLARHDAYLCGIEAAGLIPELRQSERNRRIEWQRQDDGFQAARKAAESRSIIRSIVHTSLLLHGRRSVSYVDDLAQGSAPRRIDSQFGRMSVEMEHPLQWTFDPLGVEATLTTYRTEQPLE